MTELLSKDHTILERPFMEFRPFGLDERGEEICDLTGMIVRANVDYLEEVTASRTGSDRVVQELCRLLNERIRDSAYHVNPAFLKKTWNSYSYEFVCYLREFCVQLSGDPEFAFNAGKRKKISPVFQILGRPFPVAEIYRMYPRFVQECASKDVIEVHVENVSDRSATVRLTYTDRALRQFGPYRKRCAELTCQSAKGGLCCIPEIVHRLSPATVMDRACMAQGDEWCVWEVTWASPAESSLFKSVWGRLRRAAGF